MVSSPRRLASSKARTRLSELPLVDRPTAMSPGRPKAASWRAKTTSKPTSLARAVTTATSSVRERAGRGRPPGRGCRKVVATAWASVELPPLPKANSRPPPMKDRAMAPAQSRPTAGTPDHGDGLLGVDHDGVPDHRVDQGDADLLHALAGVDHGQI